ncbi:MAG: hypothetical protein LUH05_03730 [Candidatus Gastranaerophilales bacterium]|nr:hypothetical protein [Candidatus Gastranaerophilales bacterium]
MKINSQMIESTITRPTDVPQNGNISEDDRSIFDFSNTLEEETDISENKNENKIK